jgi:hypothetical protein
MYMHGKKLKWARHVIRMFDNRMPKRIMKGSVGGRRPVGRSRNRCSRCGNTSSNCSIPKKMVSIVKTQE